MNPDYYPIELLHWAGMQDKHLPVIKDILETYPEYINTLNKELDNALMIAIRMGNTAIMEYFLNPDNFSSAIDYRHVSKEGNFFMVALRYAKKEVVDILLSKYKHLINFQDQSIDGGFFCIALKYSSPDIVRLLFTQYRELIDFSSINQDKKTFLHLAALKGYDFIFKDYGLTSQYLRAEDKNQQTCLFDLIDGYISHKNFWCFDLMDEQLTLADIKKKNIMGQNIFQYFYDTRLIVLSTVINSDTEEKFVSEAIKENIIRTYTPIFNILEQK